VEELARELKSISYFIQRYGGRRGIRTPGTVSGSAVFKTAAFDHSAILPVNIRFIIKK
jgi:hypothetical protein